MKKIIVIGLVFVAIVVIAPYFVGSSVETQFREQVVKSNSHPSYEITITEYNKGWFSSQAMVSISVNLPEEYNVNLANLEIKVNQQMQHGPILWQGSGLGFGLVDSVIEFELPQSIQEEVNKIDGLDSKALAITSRTGFDLNTTTQLTLNPFIIQEDGVEINVKSAEGQFNYTMQGYVEGTLNWQGMEIIQSENEAFTLGAINITTEQQLVSGEMFSPTALFSGFVNASIAELSVETADVAENVSMQKINMAVTSDIQQGLAKFDFVLAIKNMNIIQQKFSDIVYDFSLENIDVDVLTEMNQMLAESQNADPMAIAANMQGLLPKLIAKGPILKLNKMGMTTDAGKIDSDMQVSIDQDIYDVSNPMTMMLALDAKAKGYAPEAFFINLGMGQNIEQMVQQNFLVREQAQLKFLFSFNNGQALLNGNPMPLGM